MNKRWPDKIIIGLTGNIATGKSAVMRMAADRGAMTVDADKLVHELLDGDAELQEAVAADFGEEIRREDGRIDRETLGAIVFKDPEALARLEKIIHPPVRRLAFQRIADSPAPVAFIEAIKLLEGSLAEECDQIWVTRCPQETQIQRLVVCRGLDRAAAVTRVEAQSPQASKVARADVVLDTDGTMTDTQAYFELAWERLIRRFPMAAPRSDRMGPVAKKLPPPDLPDDVAVRRARPADVPAIALLIQKATAGTVTKKRSELLHSLGEQGYLIGQRGTEISTVAGWSAENLVAVVETIHVYPLEAAGTTGMAVLWEIEKTAIDLICEVILAILPADHPEAIGSIFERLSFAPAKREALPKPWRAALEERPPDGLLMMKILRDTRALK